MSLIRDAALAAAGGLGASLVMDRATTLFQAMQPEADRQREQAVSPGVAYEVAAEKAAGAAGIDLREGERRALGSAFHFGLGIGWAPLYPLLRRRLQLPPSLAALGTGLLLFAIVDEGLNTIIGSSAPPQAYPLTTHLRGLAGHLVYGAVVALLVELAWVVLGEESRR